MTLLLSLVLSASPQPQCAEGLIHQMPYCVPPVTAEYAKYGYDVDRWHPWIEIYFKPEDVDHALRILKCESSGNPNALGAIGEIGLFQHHPRYWAERSVRYGWGGWSPYSPDANVAVAAAMIYYDPRSWLHWSCER